jgi:hypothetical protein
MGSKRVQIEGIVNALQHGQPVTSGQYRLLERECKNVVGSLFKRCRLPDIIYNQNLREEVVEDITTMSLVKALRGYDPQRKAQFMTYYYNKARSMTEVQQGKYYRRYRIVNTVSLDDTRKVDES